MGKLHNDEVKKLRKKLGLTIEAFAGKVGVTGRTVMRWEKGSSQPSPLASKTLEFLKDNAEAQ